VLFSLTKAKTKKPFSTLVIKTKAMLMTVLVC